MRAFADTFFFLALLDPQDAAHEEAARIAKQGWREIHTTEYVLVELGNALRAPADRSDFLAVVRLVRSSSVYRVASASAELLERGLELFAARPDKEWSLTDCLSIVVMHQQKLAEVLTADRHFEQAGFRVLLS